MPDAKLQIKSEKPVLSIKYFASREECCYDAVEYHETISVKGRTICSLLYTTTLRITWMFYFKRNIYVWSKINLFPHK